eukprot:jgi/Psemu1/251734/estExt_Genewise1Plus.C_340061
MAAAITSPDIETSPPWCIVVKTVGKGFEHRRGCLEKDDSNDDQKQEQQQQQQQQQQQRQPSPPATSSTSKVLSVGTDGALSFSVTVSPDDKVDSLHDEIEDVTGVKASQQRLIYRGRLIGTTDVGPGHNGSDPNSCRHPNSESERQRQPQQEYKIRDIVGLCDGQTIHLVKKREDDTKQKNTTGGTEEGVAARSDGGEDDANRNSSSNNNNNNSNTVDGDRIGSGGGGGALLAALLGLGSLAEEGGRMGGPAFNSNNNNNNNNNNSNNNSNSVQGSPRRSPAARAASETATASESGRTPRHMRRPNYRLVEEDLRVPDPGSMESVRQGLMTLNTILNSRAPPQRNADLNSDANDDATGTHRSTTTNLQANREWFRGQWIDARDTVNQWLEATVVDVVDPSDVLDDAVALHTRTPANVHARRYGTPEQNPPRQRRVPNVDGDPAISANDLEGRRRLLLEECEPGDPNEVEPIAIAGLSASARYGRSLRPRSNNDGVQLLLIHYNGWPHRWDEWIRSDSERLRPFRTRTRHPSMSTLASPTPQSILNEAPRTNIVQDGDEEDDRLAVLPELDLAISRVSGLVGDLVRREQAREIGHCADIENDNNENSDNDNTRNSNDHRRSRNTNTNHHRRAKVDLPWMARGRSGADNDFDQSIATDNSEQDGDRKAERHSSSDADPIEASEEEEQEQEQEQEQEEEEEQYYEADQMLITDEDISRTTTYTQAELRQLATLFDRLGRTLTDAAPHIASLASSLPPPHQPSNANGNRNDHDHSSSDEGTELSNSVDLESSSAPMGGLLSLWSRERERRRAIPEENPYSARSITVSALASSLASAPVNIDPDHLDFASGVVNTTRGEVRSGPRSRPSHQDDVASLLGTYLAAASLGSISTSNDENGDNGSGFARLLQRGSGGGSGENGIDIHIHAIVTAPGVSPGGMGIATLSNGGGGGGTPMAALGPAARNVFSATNLGGFRSGGGTTSLSANIVEPTDEEDYSDLFSELYSESPTPIDPNGSPGRARTEESGSAVSSSTRSGTGSNNNGNNDDDNDNDTAGSGSNSSPAARRQSSERRSNGVFRLFRRRSSRPRDDSGGGEGT